MILEMDLDITQQRKAEAALAKAGEKVQAERQLFLNMLDTLPVIVDIIQADRRVEWANRAYRDSLGDNVGKFCYESQFSHNEPCGECQAFVPLKTGKPHHWQWTLPTVLHILVERSIVDVLAVSWILET